ncbi:MAG TPA: response regulator transcription factor [Anaerolineales bacterium]|nr:response regulator transcription factor [Anaerolineales bacterium]
MKTKILLIDDDLTLLSLLSQYLRENDYQVFEAPNGQAGLRSAYNERPDLVLLDVMLPGMDGWEVCARLREMSNIPIIMLTAKATEADKLRGFSLGVDDYVTKPFSFAELVARIQAVLSRIRDEQNSTGYVAHGEIVLDLEKFQASVAGKTLDLTPTEFRLLESLVRRKGKVASEKDLFREVWGSTRSDPALVRRYILMVRKKLEIDPSSPVWVRTVRGFGYRLGTGPLRPPLDGDKSNKK